MDRADWERTADQMLAAVRPFADTAADHALIHLPGPRQSGSGRHSDGLEGYARTFLLAAFRLAGAGDPAAVPGDLVDKYASGAAAGPKAWTDPLEVRQTMVEAASIAIGLYETRPWIWDALSPGDQERLADWLHRCTRAEPYPNNWVLFQVMINAFLKSVGAPHDQAQIERNLELADSWYRGDGWYTDGAGQSFDHYVGWAMHLYTGLWCRMDGDAADPGRAAGYRARLRKFLDDFVHLFGADGAPLHQGRSLTYRFAAVAPFWLGALLDATPLPPGQTRGVASRSLSYFLDRGALNEHGLLSMGWHREFEPVTQMYSGPASPYWASKAFLGLLLPADHDVWTADETPLPVEADDFVRPLRAPGWVAWGTKADGIVRVANHGSDRHPNYDKGMLPHYRRLAHATAAGPDLGDGCFDNEVVLGDSPVRRRIHRVGQGRSVFYPREMDKEHSFSERVEVASVVRGRVELRVVHASSPVSSAITLWGWSVADDAAAGPAVSTGDGWAMAENAFGLITYVRALYGFSAQAGVDEREGANPYGEHSAVPWLIAQTGEPVEQLYAALVVLTGEPLDPEEPIATAEAEFGRALRVVWWDGEVTELSFTG